MTDQVAADRKVAREVIGADISDEEFDKAPDVLGNVYRIAAEKAPHGRESARVIAVDP
ncbi:hypothetical protein [Streptomyces coeruleorubidus]